MNVTKFHFCQVYTRAQLIDFWNFGSDTFKRLSETLLSHANFCQAVGDDIFNDQFSVML